MIKLKNKIKGCACYGVNSIHPCFCTPFSNRADNQTPAEKKIASIRKEIAILVNEKGVTVTQARKAMNTKYGKGWRERGLISNSDNQWTEEELKTEI
jgi:hypothetical protein